MNIGFGKLFSSEAEAGFPPEILAVPRPVFLALQGGGAKGVAHVGAIAAVERFRFEVRGISGTSAGSMVAALVACGYSSAELVDAEQKTHIFSTRGEKLSFKKPTDIFTEDGWAAIFKVRAILTEHPSWLKFIKKMVMRPRGGIALALLIRGMRSSASFLIAALAIYLVSKWGVSYSVPTFLLMIIVVASLIASVGRKVKWVYKKGVLALGGVCDAQHVSDLIDQAIVLKLKEHGYKGDGQITFRDLSNLAVSHPLANIKPLKIVATNVAHECLELFCVDRTPDVKIGDAVAASVCLPVVFKPWNLSFKRCTEHGSEEIDGQFLDGGLVSNLPAWPFDEERLLDPAAGTIAFSIESNEAVEKKHWTMAIVGSVVNGSSLVHTRAAGSALKIPLKPKIDMMQFDVSEDDVFDIVAETKVKVYDRIYTAIDQAGTLEDAAKKFYLYFTEQIKNFYSGWLMGDPNAVVRLSIAAERGGSMNSLTSMFAEGFDFGDPAAKLTRRSDCWIFKPFSEEDILAHPGVKFSRDCDGNLSWIFHDLGRKAHDSEIFMGERVWRSAKWMACFPIHRPSSQNKRVRQCVIVIESDAYWLGARGGAEAESKLIDFMNRASQLIKEYDSDFDIMDCVQGENTWL
ncbi:patatin-like phospholipase family protein [Pseudomonas koreensis]|uniref:patatin-like phospholipase family protein n=1 Tax=Pseudomonas koreensis TaxID=198620 RepID=UPI002FC73E6E